MSDIILFHVEGEDFLKKMVLNELEYIIFNPEDEVKYTSKFIIYAISRIILKKPAHFLRNIFSIEFYRAHIRRYKILLIVEKLKTLKPKVVITFIDNSTLFHQSCKLFKEVPFLAIQNGGRHSWCASNLHDDIDLKFFIDEYFCFGPYVKDLFERNHHNIEKYITYGSMVGGYFFEKYKPSFENKKKYDICIISQWSENLLDIKSLPTEWRRLEEAISVMTNFVAQYSFKNKLNICVALRGNSPSEKQFFEKYFNGRCTYSHGDRLSFTSYKTAVNSNLIIAINSTLASEMFGMGGKVLFVNPFGEKWLQPTLHDGIWYITTPTYKTFHSRASKLLDMDYKEYLRLSRTEMNYVMSYNKIPAHTVIRNRITQIINNK